MQILVLLWQVPSVKSEHCKNGER